MLMQVARDEADIAESASDKADQMRSSTRLKRPDSGKVDAMAELRARRAQAQEKSTKSTKGGSKYAPLPTLPTEFLPSALLV